MNILAEKNIAISSHFLHHNWSHRDNSINSSIVINRRKVKDTYIDYNCDKDLKFWDRCEVPIRIARNLIFCIQICIIAKHFSDSSSSYKIKDDTWSKK